MPNGRRAKKGATRRYAAFRVNPLSQIAFAPITSSPCRPPSSHDRPAHHQQQPGAERACRSSAQRPAVAAGGRPFRRRCWPGPTGTDKIGFSGPSSSVPFSAVRPRTALDGTLRPIGNFPLQQVRTKSASQTLLAPYLSRHSGAGQVAHGLVANGLQPHPSGPFPMAGHAFQS